MAISSEKRCQMSISDGRNGECVDNQLLAVQCYRNAINIHRYVCIPHVISSSSIHNYHMSA
jgi:hypothetical protein